MKRYEDTTARFNQVEEASTLCLVERVTQLEYRLEEVFKRLYEIQRRLTALDGRVDG